MKKIMKLNLIAAACENWGIGYKGELPWFLKNELRHLSKTTRKISDPTKKNVVIMGRISYFSVPESKRPLQDRLNVVLTTEPEKYEFPSTVIVAKSLNEALEKLQSPEIVEQIENVWILGGNSVYKEAMESPHCDKIYLTRILAEFECDAFFPKLTDNFIRIPNDPDIPEEIQEEDGIKYQYQVYQKVNN